MIAKCQPIGHGKTAIAYALDLSKGGILLDVNYISGNNPMEIFHQFELVNGNHSRVSNKYLRFEIGIAPEDEASMNTSKLRQLIQEFTQEIGLSEYQYIAATHRNTDNLHIHLIVNRVSMAGTVFDVGFIGNRSAKVAEVIARRHGLVIANERRRGYAYTRTFVNDPAKEQALEEVRAIANRAYATTHNKADFFGELAKAKVQVEAYRNTLGVVVGLRLHFGVYCFKASLIGRKFSNKSLEKHFSALPKPVKRTEQKQIRPNSYEIPLSQAAANAVRKAGIAMSATTHNPLRRHPENEDEEQQDLRL